MSKSSGRAAEYERRILDNRTGYLTLLAIVAVLAVGARFRTNSEDAALVTLESPRN